MLCSTVLLILFTVTTFITIVPVLITELILRDNFDIKPTMKVLNFEPTMPESTEVLLPPTPTATATPTIDAILAPTFSEPSAIFTEEELASFDYEQAAMFGTIALIFALVPFIFDIPRPRPRPRPPAVLPPLPRPRHRHRHRHRRRSPSPTRFLNSTLPSLPSIEPDFEPAFLTRRPRRPRRPLRSPSPDSEPPFLQRNSPYRRGRQGLAGRSFSPPPPPPYRPGRRSLFNTRSRSLSPLRRQFWSSSSPPPPYSPGSPPPPYTESQ